MGFKAPAQDRFIAYCDAADLVDAVRTAAHRGAFKAEHNCGLVHPGFNSELEASGIR